MPRHLVVPLLCLLPAWGAFIVDFARADEGFTPLFNGQDLAGWHGDPRLWSVEDGLVVGTTDEHTIRSNSFLATTQPYKNFVLKAKFKLRNGNSGIQIRSKQHENFVVKGYQADIAEQRYMGILYEEGGRGILRDVDPEKVKPHVKAGEWNEYVITVDGNHITQQLNGFTTVDYTEDSPEGATEGIIALQLHVGPKMRVEFKDVEIKELP
ncbi:MAG: DUF1080 domain-containing protein [Pirellulales bacterium]|nr:DUF1080 domain-containing protein [Pirellulales bacterium]